LPSSVQSLSQALELALDAVTPLSPQEFGLGGLGGLTAAQGATALVASPSVDSSRKEGYALQSRDVAGASEENPVRLQVVGLAAAGETSLAQAAPGVAVRVFTGAELPRGADAVLPEEMTRVEGDEVLCLAETCAGRNVLPAGTDVAPGQEVVSTGDILTPAMVGILAAAGHTRLRAHPLPRVGVIATGRELAKPGEQLGAGGLYASNLVTLSAWLRRLGIAHQARAVDDDQGAIQEAIQEMLPNCDAMITSGGVGRSDRDLVLEALAGLGWQKVFKGVRMGPGKGMALGKLGEVPVFCLPGGPPACHSGFIVVALPALARMAGRQRDWLPRVRARLGQDHRAASGWSRILHGQLEEGAEGPIFRVHKGSSRLMDLAQAQALWVAREGKGPWQEGDLVTVRSLVV
jgi:molybdopterin molybdotransferase